MQTTHLVWLLIAGGAMCVLADLLRIQACKTTKPVYQYIPRSFSQEQDNPLRPTQAFTSMFNKSDPWLGIASEEDRSSKGYNEYSISQE